MRKMWVALGKTARKMVPEGAARAYWWMAGICLWCAMTFWGETTSSSNAQFAPGNRCWRGFSLNFFCSGLGSGVSLVLAIQYSSEHKCQIMRQIRKTCLCYPFLTYTSGYIWVRNDWATVAAPGQWGRPAGALSEYHLVAVFACPGAQSYRSNHLLAFFQPSPRVYMVTLGMCCCKLQGYCSPSDQWGMSPSETGKQTV